MVYVFLADGFEEIEALTVVDILRRGDIPVKTISITINHTVCGAHSINVIADGLLDDVKDDIDMLVLPGGMPGTTNLDANEKLRTLLLKAIESGKYVAAICAAPLILGKLGVLKDKTATCYPSFESYLEGASLSTDRVCFSENIITSRGPGTASDFALFIVEKLKGKELRDKIHGDMLYD